jgi:hypothetical protein
MSSQRRRKHTEETSRRAKWTMCRKVIATRSVNATIPTRFKVQLESASEAVRGVVGPETVSGISDREIRDAVWEFYFDVQESVTFLLGGMLLHVNYHRPCIYILSKMHKVKSEPPAMQRKVSILSRSPFPSPLRQPRDRSLHGTQEIQTCSPLLQVQDFPAK